MQDEQAANIKIDTDVLKEKDHANVAWSDQYSIEILTEQSQTALKQINQIKEERRLGLSQQLFMEWKDHDFTAEEIIQNRMEEMPVFTTKADYYSLNIKEKPQEYSTVFLIVFFAFLGLAGYWLARFFKKGRKERENDVHNSNITV